jgi:hypothetical protein
LRAYRAARDPAGLAGVLQALADDLPAHWLLAGLLSLSSQLVDYLAVAETVDGEELLRAIASLEVEDELTAMDEGGIEPPDAPRAGADG